VVADGAAAAGAPRPQQFDAERIEHARGGGVDVGRHRRLHAAFEHQHAARMGAGRRGGPGGCRLGRRHLGLERARQQGAHRLAGPQRGCKGAAGQALLERAAHQLLRGAAADLVLDHLATDVHQPAVLHARGAGGLAVAAGQAAVQMQLRLGAGRLSFQHALDEIDAAARAVELVAEQLVGGAGGRAEAAVHALAQDGVGLLALGRVLDEVGESGLHGGR